MGPEPWGMPKVVFATIFLLIALFRLAHLIVTPTDQFNYITLIIQNLYCKRHEWIWLISQQFWFMVNQHCQVITYLKSTILSMMVWLFIAIPQLTLFMIWYSAIRFQLNVLWILYSIRWSYSWAWHLWNEPGARLIIDIFRNPNPDSICSRRHKGTHWNNFPVNMRHLRLDIAESYWKSNMHMLCFWKQGSLPSYLRQICQATSVLLYVICHTAAFDYFFCRIISF